MSENIGERLKRLRKHFQLTQEGFATRLKVTRGAIANYEVSRNEPSDVLLELVSREFGASVEWLKTGRGEMLETRKKELETFFEDLLAESESSFRKRLVSMLAELTPKEWELLEAVARKLTADPGSQDSS